MEEQAQEVTGNEGNTLYVKNLSDKVRKQGKFQHKAYDRFIIELKTSLYFLFSQYGEVLDIVTKKTKNMRGQAFIVFNRQDDAANALKNLQNFNIFDKNIVRIQKYSQSEDVNSPFMPSDKVLNMF